MNGNSSAKACGIALAVTLASVIWCGLSHAITFGFSDEYYIAASKCATTYQSTFGTQNGCINSSGNIYQQTDSTTNPVTVIKIAGNTVSIPGEFVQNTTPDASQGLQLFGWGQSLNNGELSRECLQHKQPC
jgi:hypothetical protein